MIAYLGEIMFKAGTKKSEIFGNKKSQNQQDFLVIKESSNEIDIMPRQRTDDVNVVWKKQSL